jgi:hypothetical protein
MRVLEEPPRRIRPCRMAGPEGYRGLGAPTWGPGDLAAHDGVLMPQHQKRCILGRLARGQHHQAANRYSRRTGTSCHPAPSRRLR